MVENCRGDWKWYVASVFGAMSLYATVLVISISWLHHDPPAPWKYAIAVLPVLPALWIPFTAVRYFRVMDELQKKIHLEALAFAFTSAAMLTFTYGFLQNAGLPDVSWVWVWPVMGTCLLAGQAIARRRYR